LGNTQPHADNPLALITKWNRWILHAFWRWRKPWKTDEKNNQKWFSGLIDFCISVNLKRHPELNCLPDSQLWEYKVVSPSYVLLVYNPH
jgi:hypothetical protein